MPHSENKVSNQSVSRYKHIGVNQVWRVWPQESHTHTHPRCVQTSPGARRLHLSRLLIAQVRRLLPHSHTLVTEREREVKYSFVAVHSMRNYWTVQLSCAHFVVSRKKLWMTAHLIFLMKICLINTFRKMSSSGRHCSLERVKSSRCQITGRENVKLM